MYNVIDQEELKKLMSDGWSWHGGGGMLEEPNTYILVDEDGNEYTAVVSDEPVNLDATANDIRIGTTAATNTGVTEGTKVIPSYIVVEGFCEVASGAEMKIKMYSEMCHYTKLQAMVCDYNDTVINSVSTNKVVIESKVYNVNSTEALSEVAVDSENLAIDLSIINESDKTVLIRYFTYKEVY